MTPVAKSAPDAAQAPRSNGSRAGLNRRSLLRGAAGLVTAAAASVAMPRYVYSQSDRSHKLKGKTIEMAILGIAGWLPSGLGVQMSPLFAEYTKDKFGYDVKFTSAGAPFSGLFQKAATSLATRSQEYNIIISDSQWLGALATPKWILNLDKVIKQNPELNVEWYSDVIRDAYQIYPDGTTHKWGFPQEGDTIVLFVRKDLVENPAEQQAFQAKYNMKLPSTFEDFENLTMDEFEKVAEFFTRPDKNLYGTAMQYSREYDFCTCYLYPFMFSQGGDIWDPKTGQVYGILNSDINARAMEQARGWLKYQPPGAVNYGIAEEVDVFTQDKVATVFQWAAVGLAMITDKNKDRVMVVPPPKHGTGASAKRIYTIGGQPWVINRFNDEDHMTVALDFMKWWYQPDTALEYAKRGGNPCDKPTLTRSGFDQLHPWYRAYKFMLEEGRSRDFWHDPKYSEMLSLQQEGFTSYMTGQSKDAKHVLDYIACGQQAILSKEKHGKAPPAACSGITL